MLVRLDAERKREELVCNVHLVDCLVAWER